jgi:hypothetical protein
MADGASSPISIPQRPIPRVALVRTDVGALGGGTSLHPAGGTFVWVDPWRGGLRRGLGLMWLRGALPGAGMVYRTVRGTVVLRLSYRLIKLGHISTNRAQ